MLTVKIQRCKNKDDTPVFEQFTYDGDEHVSVLNVLEFINEHGPDNDKDKAAWRPIQYESSCEQGLCGACAMVVNDRPVLACQTFCDEVKSRAGIITIMPLSKFPVVCDLIVDRSELEESLKVMKVWLDSDAENTQPKSKNTNQYEAALCLHCGCCLEACPNYASGDMFKGAFGAVNAMNILEKNKNNEHFKEMKKEYVDHFFKTCTKSGACEKACPAHLPTMMLISEGNRNSVWSVWQLLAKK